MTTTITQDIIRNILEYRDGKLYWKEHRSARARKGDEAGSVSNGYRVVGIQGINYYTHHLVWLWHYGKFPENEIDHTNRIKDDNSIGNLNDATRSTNNMNRGMFANNTSGYTGVQLQNNKWKASMKVNNQTIYLGIYKNIEDAAMIAMSARLQLGFNNNHGE